MSRVSCLNCSRKHVAAAEVLMAESLLGYPLHAWLSVGHLEQAEEELLSDYPEAAEHVRQERVAYIDGLVYSVDDTGEIVLKVNYHVDTVAIIKMLTILEINKNVEEEVKKRKRRK